MTDPEASRGAGPRLHRAPRAQRADTSIYLSLSLCRLSLGGRQGKMLSKYFSKALAEAGVDLPEVEVRDLTFLADPKSCGWIKKEDFLRVTVRARRCHCARRNVPPQPNPTQPK